MLRGRATVVAMQRVMWNAINVMLNAVDDLGV